MYDHPFLEEMEGLGIDNCFEGENFFFFGELDAGEDVEAAQAEDVTVEIITEHGGYVAMEEWQKVPHGGLVNLEELMEERFLVYEAIVCYKGSTNKRA